MSEIKHKIMFEMTDEGMAMYERIKRLAECDDSKLVINALSLYWELLKVVADGGVVLVYENGKKKPQVLSLP